MLDWEGKERDACKVFAQPILSIAGEKRTIAVATRSSVFCLQIEKGKIRGVFLFNPEGVVIEAVKLRRQSIFFSTAQGVISTLKIVEKQTENNFEVSADVVCETRLPLRMSMDQKPKKDEQDIRAMLQETNEEEVVEWKCGKITAFEVFEPHHQGAANTNTHTQPRILAAAEGDFIGWVYELGSVPEKGEDGQG